MIRQLPHIKKNMKQHTTHSMKIEKIQNKSFLSKYLKMLHKSYQTAN